MDPLVFELHRSSPDEQFATTMSGTPSRLTSVTATEKGECPPESNTFDNWKETRVKRVLIPAPAPEPLKPLEIDIIEGGHKETIQLKQ